MQVIGAGYGRTGTLSLKLALEQLTNSRCYHMEEVLSNWKAPSQWLAAASDSSADYRRPPIGWRALLAGYGCTVDWPSTFFYKDLMLEFPDSKIVLSVRDFDAWYKSATDTIYSTHSLIASAPVLADVLVGRLFSMIESIVWQRTFHGRFEDKEYVRQIFLEHIETVKRTVPADRLLVFDVKQGWGPLCKFLDVPVPDTPFPRANDSADFQRRFGHLRVAVRVIRTVQYLAVILLAVAVFLLAQLALNSLNFLFGILLELQFALVQFALALSLMVVTVEYHSGQLTGDGWTDPNLRIVLITKITFSASTQAKESSVQNQTQTESNQGSFIKFSVQIEGDWGFEQESNTLQVVFKVTAPVAERSICDSKESWTVAYDSQTAKNFRVFLANDTATTLGLLKECTLDDRQQQSVQISDPHIFDNLSGWTTTVAFASFSGSMYYDPSFALLLGYSDEFCDPLLAWILPVSFISGAGAIILFFVFLIYFPPTTKLLMGERSFQIQEVRGDIKKDYRREIRGLSMTLPSSVVAASLQQQNNEVELKIITNAEEVDELFSTPR